MTTTTNTAPDFARIERAILARLSDGERPEVFIFSDLGTFLPENLIDAAIDFMLEAGTIIFTNVKCGDGQFRPGLALPHYPYGQLKPFAA